MYTKNRMDISSRFLLTSVPLLVIACFWANQGYSYQSKHPESSLDPVIVSASRVQLPSKHIADQTDVLTQEDLKKLPAKDLAEALNYVPGVDIQNNGPFGQASSISIRGAYSRQVLVMVDGIPFNSQLSGQANPSRIPIENAEQIEIIKGGDSSVWGSSLGGVVNVITKPVGTTDIPKGHLTTSFGQMATTKNSMDLSGKLGKIGYYAFGSFMHADGNLPQSRSQEVKNFTKLGYDFNDDVHLTTSFGYSGAHFRYGPTKPAPDVLLIDQPYVSRYGATTLTVDRDDDRFTASFKFHNQRSTQNSKDLTVSLFSTQTFRQSLYKGISLNNVYTFDEDHILTNGLDTDWYTIKSATDLPKPKGINMQAPYANFLWRLEDFDLIPALRFDRNSRFGSQLSPSFGAVYHIPVIWEGGLIRAKASRVFNAPPLLWIYNEYNYFGYQGLPNPDLKAERALMYEVGLEGPLVISGLKGELNVYRSHVRNALTSITDNTAHTIQYRNTSKAVRQGVEARLDYKWNKVWDLYTAGTFTDVWDASTKKNIRDGGITKETFKWGSSYTWPFGLTFTLEGAYNRWTSSPTRANDRKPIFNARLIEDMPNFLSNTIELQIFFNVYNITNSSYWADPLYPIPGRYVEGGVTVSF